MKKQLKIGFITDESFPMVFYKPHLNLLRGVLSMRSKFIAKELKQHKEYKFEIYKPQRKYDIVFFIKNMNKEAREELIKIKQYGGITIFDANVNYYEIWGDYIIPETKPTPQQQEAAIFMTEKSDYVIADSTYIGQIASKFSPNVFVIPDNVNLSKFKKKKSIDNEIVNIIWSGVSKKSLHLMLIKDVLHQLQNENLKYNLILVSEKLPQIYNEMKNIENISWYKYSDRKYSSLLSKSDIIISPKILNNAYELGHTEYKITLGMAVGLPAVASPQLSYIEAIGYKSGGFIANTEEEWFNYLKNLIESSESRNSTGKNAYETVIEQYSTQAVAKLYLNFLEKINN